MPVQSMNSMPLGQPHNPHLTLLQVWYRSGQPALTSDNQWHHCTRAGTRTGSMVPELPPLACTRQLLVVVFQAKVWWSESIFIKMRWGWILCCGFLGAYSSRVSLWRTNSLLYHFSHIHCIKLEDPKAGTVDLHLPRLSKPKVTCAINRPPK